MSFQLALSLGHSLRDGQLCLNGFGLLEVPEELFRLTHLSSLELSRNEITNLPDGFSALTNLRSLSLDNNRIEAIPSWITNLRSLRWLILDDNCIERLPAEMEALPFLHGLTLRHNRLPEEVFVCGDREECVATIRRVSAMTDWRIRPWSPSSHPALPPSLREEIETFYLLYHISTRQCSPSPLQDLPLELVFAIIEFLRQLHLSQSTSLQPLRVLLPPPLQISSTRTVNTLNVFVLEDLHNALPSAEELANL